MQSSPDDDAASEMVQTITDNIEKFLADRPNKIVVDIDDPAASFRKFARLIGAEGDIESALNEFTTKHNPSKVDTSDGIPTYAALIDLNRQSSQENSALKADARRSSEQIEKLTADLRRASEENSALKADARRSSEQIEKLTADLRRASEATARSKPMPSALRGRSRS